MKRLVFPTGTKREDLSVIENFLDQHDITWAERLSSPYSWAIITVVSDQVLNFLTLAAQVYAPGTVIRDEPDHVVSVSTSTTANTASTSTPAPVVETWYQFVQRVRGATGYRITTGRHDRVMVFEELEDTFRWVIRRSKFRETRARDIEVEAVFEATVLVRKGKHNWEPIIVSAPDPEPLCEYVNYGKVYTPGEVWRRAQEADKFRSPNEVAQLGAEARVVKFFKSLGPIVRDTSSPQNKGE